MMGKSLLASVGRSARNAYDDVRLVQYLLNCVPTPRGGPTRELVIDGVCGPLTMQAIAGFQRTLHGPADGRVDPGGPTFRALAAYDPYPQQPLPPGNPGWKSGKTDAKGSVSGYYKMPDLVKPSSGKGDPFAKGGSFGKGDPFAKGDPFGKGDPMGKGGAFGGGGAWPPTGKKW